ncbi:MAG: site-specific DNA-methyltransferase [Oscillospiraceae bacterium]|nr:site-specific DNA-methyltransferase [Oscillospiraceae bacterium]
MPELTWIGKEKVVNHHQAVPFRVLEEQYSHGAETSGNMIIHGDNLEALKALLPRYEGRVKCIYIDPPYNTGNEGWVYNDNVNDPKIKKWLGEVVGKEGEDLSRHDKWLCMMYPRLKLLQKLLADDGAIFISIDDNEKFNLKQICDEIFGNQNFIADIAVINNLKGRSDGKYIATAHESLLIYHKGSFITNGVSVPEEYDKEYKLVDKYGRYRLLGLRKRGSNSRRIDRPNLWYPFYYNEELNRLALTRIDNCDIEIYPHLSDGTDGNWRWGKETAKVRIEQLTVQKVKGRGEYDVFQKDYITDEKRIKPKSFWMGPEFAAETGTLEIKSILGKDVFSTPKPIGIISYILKQCALPDDIVLDSFAGSGTTAHAVLNMNKADGGSRKFILVEMEDYADSITAERVKRVIDGYGEGKSAVEGTGGGFSFFELGAPLLYPDGNLNEAVGVEKIREYIWYTETKASYAPQDGDGYYLGKHGETGYYFYYEPDRVTSLGHTFLSQVQEKAGGYVIYADRCDLSDAELSEYGVKFKKIPRDITKI